MPILLPNCGEYSPSWKSTLQKSYDIAMMKLSIFFKLDWTELVPYNLPAKFGMRTFC